MHIHPYERLWIRLSVIMLIVFGIAIALSSLTFGIEIPGATRRAVATGLPADATPEQSWIRELGPGRYEVNMIARMWGFDPNEIRIPKGSTVTFYLHSQDVLHGIKIRGTTVSMMVIPGQVGRATYTFDEPGEYIFLCHEYCGLGHHVMSGKIIVEG